MKDISKSVIGSLISAVVIALVFSLWNDFVYKNIQLTGYWKVEFETVETSYNKYKGLKTHYEFIIGQNGNILSGTGEKISENSSKGTIEYTGNQRTNLEFNGTMIYRFFSKNIVEMICKENGKKRPSSTIVNLVIESDRKMRGTYVSTIASSKGNVIFTKVH